MITAEFRISFNSVITFVRAFRFSLAHCFVTIMAHVVPDNVWGQAKSMDEVHAAFDPRLIYTSIDSAKQKLVVPSVLI